MIVQGRYRTFWPRFWAGWIDALAMIPLLGIDWVIQHTIHAPVILAIWFVAYQVSGDLYSVGMHARYGQTLGKMMRSGCDRRRTVRRTTSQRRHGDAP